MNTRRGLLLALLLALAATTVRSQDKVVDIIEKVNQPPLITLSVYENGALVAIEPGLDFKTSGGLCTDTAGVKVTCDLTGLGGGGSSAFSAITSSTNTTAAMVCGTGCSIGVSGSGTNTATAVPVGGVTGLGTGVATFLATPSAANFAAAITGPVTVPAGGSGAATFTNHGVLLGAGASAFGVTAVGTTGQCLTGNTGADPTWGSCGSGFVNLQATTPGTQQGGSGAGNVNINGTAIVEQDSLAATTSDAIIVQNTTASSGGTTAQVSPDIKLSGTAWNSSGAASETDAWRIRVVPITVAGTTTSQIRMDSSIAGGAYTNPFLLSSAGALTIGANFSETGNIVAGGGNSLVQLSSQPGGSGGFQLVPANGGTGTYTSQSASIAALSGATGSTGGSFLTGGSMIAAVTYRITTTITGATGFQIGDGNLATRFCSTQSTLTAGTTGTCLNAINCQSTTCSATNGMFQSANAALVVTSTGSNFTGGAIRLQVYYLVFVPPTS